MGIDSTGMIREAPPIVILKIGGSSITHKDRIETVSWEALTWFSNTIASSIHESYLSTTLSSEGAGGGGGVVVGSAVDDEGTATTDYGRSSASANDDEEDSVNNVMESESKEKPCFIIIHGAGSFGHQHAKQYGLKGKSEPPPGVLPSSFSNSWHMDSMNDYRRHLMTGLSQTRASVKKLNNEVVSSLVQAGVNAVGISPCMNIPHLHAHGGDEHGGITNLVLSIQQALCAGLVPVIHGDAGLYGYHQDGKNDDAIGQEAGILSGDTLVEVIANHEYILGRRINYGNKDVDTIDNNSSQQVSSSSVPSSRVIFITDVDGVFTKDPRSHDDAVLLSRIEIDSKTGNVVTDNITASASSHEHDVTGGLKTKLGAAANVAQMQTDVVIVKCCSKSAEQALSGESPVLGTLISSFNKQ